MARAIVTFQFQGEFGDQDSDPSCGVRIQVLDRVTGDMYSAFLRVTKTIVANLSTDAAVRTAIKNRVVQEYAARGVTIQASDLVMGQ